MPPHLNMNDLPPSAERSLIMSRVRRKDTKPEMVVRRLLHAAGYRYRLHVHDLPGRPDLAFPSRRKAIFVHGCFWHRHLGCPRSTIPRTRVEFWRAKFAANIERDKRKIGELESLGWECEIVWECETREPKALLVRLLSFLGPRRVSEDAG